MLCMLYVVRVVYACVYIDEFVACTLRHVFAVCRQPLLHSRCASLSGRCFWCLPLARSLALHIVVVRLMLHTQCDRMPHSMASGWHIGPGRHCGKTAHGRHTNKQRRCFGSVGCGKAASNHSANRRIFERCVCVAHCQCGAPTFNSRTVRAAAVPVRVPYAVEALRPRGAVTVPLQSRRKRCGVE